MILESASLQIFEGETITVIGESGSGKSVFLKMLVGLIAPDAGKVLFKGEDVTRMDSEQLQKVRQQAGYVFQNDALFDSLTVLENVGFGLMEHTEQTMDQIRVRAIECLEMVGLQKDILEQMPADLSGGMRRRVGLARTIAMEPEIIIYDEPMAGLDPQNITRVERMIQFLQDRLGATSIIATHEIGTAFQISDRLAMLHEHGFPYVGTPGEMRAMDSKVVHEFIDEALSVAERRRA